MKTTFIILLTALIMGIIGAQKAQAADRVGQPLKITIVEKCEYVEGSIWISTIKDDYEIYDFSTAPISNDKRFTADYIPNSGIHMSFYAPYVYGAPSWYSIKIYQDSPANVLVNESISISGGRWGDYVVPRPTEFTGEQVNLYIEVTALW